jgi:TrmH family RNA methyltransferase
VQRLRRLVSHRTARWEERRFVVEGPKLLAEALSTGTPVEAVYLAVRAAGAAHRELAEEAARAGATVLDTQPGVLERVAATVTPQPVMAIVAMTHTDVERLDLAGLTVVCAGLRDPGNAGTVVRSAAASGSQGVVFCAGGVDLYNPKTVRASAGAVFHVPVACGTTPEEVLDRLGRLGVHRVGAVARGGRDHDAVEWSGSQALVLGSESQGLGTDLGRHLDGVVTIPMSGGTESLNVAMAATVVCFEAARQRRAAPRQAAPRVRP